MRASSGFRLASKPSRQRNREHKPQLHRRQVFVLNGKKLVNKLVYGIILQRFTKYTSHPDSEGLSLCMCTITHAIETRPYFNRPGLEANNYNNIDDASSGSGHYYNALHVYDHTSLNLAIHDDRGLTFLH